MLNLDAADSNISSPRIAVVLPCFKVGTRVDAVLKQIPACVSTIFVVDDACPDASGVNAVARFKNDGRVRLCALERNQGVGGAVLAGMSMAIDDGASVIVKIDGDGQMDPTLIPYFINPIIDGSADYTKGNRFYFLESSASMPVVRRIGNLGLTFISRLSTGYYSVSDPTNGYFAIDSRIVRALPLEKIDRRYFFETDMLFRLNTMRACVLQIPHDAHYGDEESSLRVGGELFGFAWRHIKTYVKRLGYAYILRDFNVGSVQLLLGLLFVTWGGFGGLNVWITSNLSGEPTSGGALAFLQVMAILGTFSIYGFLNYDINREPRQVMSPLIPERPAKPLKQFQSVKPSQSDDR